MKARQPGKWIGGLAAWTVGDTAYLSIAFTWLIEDAYLRAAWYRALGYRVIAGGPALFQEKMRHNLDEVAEIPTREMLIDGRMKTVGAAYPDAIAHHNPWATFASRGCPVNCSFCLVPSMEGLEFTLLDDFIPRPILCDNNLSALPPEYQDHIIARYRAAGVELVDCNSGFEPITFTDEVYARWKDFYRGPWRFAFDEQKERTDVERVMRMLSHLPPKKKRVYVLIGNEPKESCLDRCREVVAWGGEPHVQAMIKLTALQKRPWVRFDWTEQDLIDTQRIGNRFLYKTEIPDWDLTKYRRSAKTSRDRFDPRQGLFF